MRDVVVTSTVTDAVTSTVTCHGRRPAEVWPTDGRTNERTNGLEEVDDSLPPLAVVHRITNERWTA